MKIVLKPTGEFTQINGLPCRLWKGETDAGTPVEMFSPLLRSPADAPQEDLARELKELPPQNVTHAPISLRQVL